MFRRAACAAAIVLGAGLAACSHVSESIEPESGYALQEVKGFQFDDAKIEKSFATTAQLPRPARLAVYGVEIGKLRRRSDERIVELEEALANDGGRFSEILPLPDFLVGAGVAANVGVLREAAARAHADALLLYEVRVESEEDYSVLCILNLAILPCWIVPSVTWEVRLRTMAALVDVRNGLVYATLHDARSRTGFSPSAWAGGSAKKARSELRRESFAALAKKLREVPTAGPAPAADDRPPENR